MCASNTVIQTFPQNCILNKKKTFSYNKYYTFIIHIMEVSRPDILKAKCLPIPPAFLRFSVSFFVLRAHPHMSVPANDAAILCVKYTNKNCISHV